MFNRPPRSVEHVERGQTQLLPSRDFVLPEDVKSFAKDVLRHRLTPSFDALAVGLGVEARLDALLRTARTP